MMAKRHQIDTRTMDDADDEATCATSRRQWDMLQLEQALRSRCSREELVRRRILRCELNEVVWEQCTTAQSSEWTRKRPSANNVSESHSGLQFRIQVLFDGSVIAQGTPTAYSYEQLAIRPRARTATLCHPPKATQRSLSRVEAAATYCDVTASFPTKIELFRSSHNSVYQLACGVSHCVALVRDVHGESSLFTWGIGRYGQLGLGDRDRTATIMTPVTMPTALREEFAMTSSRQCDVYVRCGPLSSSLTVSQASGTTVWLWGRLPSSSGATEQTIPSPSIVPSSSFRVRDVSMGLTHLVLLSEEGHVYSWGDNDVGQLGIGLHRRNDQLTSCVQRVEFHRSEDRIRAVACGYDHTIALTADGLRVFAWGSNRLGSCGASTKFFEYFHPVLVKTFFKPATSIDCRAHTSIAVVGSGEDRHVFVWGVTAPTSSTLQPTTANLGQFWSVSAGYGCIECLSETDLAEASDGITCGECVGNSSSQACSKEAAMELTVLGVSVCPSSQQPTIDQLRWIRPTTHRLRVFVGDTAVFLLHTPEASHLDVNRFGVVSQTDGAAPAAVVEVRTLTPTFIIVTVSTTVADVVDIGLHGKDPLILMTIVTCASTSSRTSVLAWNQTFIQRCFDDSANNFDSFLTSLRAGCHDVYDAIAHSPLVDPFSAAHLAPVACWDIDRCVLETAARLGRCHLANVPEAFILWSGELSGKLNEERIYLIGSTLDAIEGLSFTDLLLPLGILQEGDRKTLPAVIGSAPVFIPSHESKPVSLHTTEVVAPVVEITSITPDRRLRSLEVANTLHVPQHALDFLVEGSVVNHQSAGCHTPLRCSRLPCDGVTMWIDDLGDNFYAESSTEVGSVQIYTPVHASPQSKSQLQYLLQSLHDFLWSYLRTQHMSIRQLHTTLSPTTDTKTLRVRLQSLGFGTRCRHDETWYSLLRMLQNPQDNDSDVSHATERRGLSLHALRVFLVDPFHTEFWRGYLEDWVSATSVLDSWAVRQLVADTLSRDIQAGEDIPWQEGSDRLNRLHAGVGLDVPPSSVCRLLYRFDKHANGQDISLLTFATSLLHHIGVNQQDCHRSSDDQPMQGLVSRGKHRPPNVDTFATPSAVAKLYQARARSRTPSPSTESNVIGRATELLRVGNSRLARIRNLPVSKLISEGVHFRSLPSNAKRMQYGISPQSGDSDDE